MTTNNRFDQLYAATSLGRPIDPAYPSNLAILILTSVLAILAGGYSLFTGGDLNTALQAGFWTGLAVLMTWIIGREVDPDYPLSAFVAVAFVTLAMGLLDFPSVAVLALFLITAAIRTVSRVIGPPLKFADSIILLVGTGVLALTQYWLLGLVIALAFLLDRLLVNPIRRHLGFALGAIAIVVMRGLWDIGSTQSLTMPYLLISGGIGLTYLLTLFATRRIQCDPDVPGFILDVRRIRAAMGVALIAGFIVAIWYGDQGVIAFAPLWSALLATAVYRLPITIKEWSAFRERVSS